MDERENAGFAPGTGFGPAPDCEGKSVYRHSKLGIASFIIGLVSVIAFIVCLFVAASSIMDYVDLNGKTVHNIEEIADDTPLIASALIMIFCVGDSLVGLILGIVGACTKHTRKVFSALGIVLNAVLAVGFVGLLIFGLLIQYSS